MTENQQPIHLRRIRSYILRQGRHTDAQRNALESHWQQYGIDNSTAPLDFTQLFHRTSDVILEIGFGNGESLLHQSIQFPEKNFIGIEVHGPGIGYLLHRVAELKLSNIRIIRHDAVEVLTRRIADNSLACVQLFFPDPWHKRRHHKRRLLQAEFARLVLCKLKPGGKIHMATDWQNYARQMLNIMDNTENFTNLAGKGRFSDDKGTRTETKFERRGKKLGHNVWDLIYYKS